MIVQLASCDKINLGNTKQILHYTYTIRYTIQIQHKLLLFATDHQTFTRLNHKTDQRVNACVLNGQ